MLSGDLNVKLLCGKLVHEKLYAIVCSAHINVSNTEWTLDMPSIGISSNYIFNSSVVIFFCRPSHSRNIAIKIQLMENEDPKSALKAIYGKSCSPELATEAYTAVTYHNR